MKKVIIMRGIPGSGKSTWIKENHSNAIICSADNFFLSDDGVYTFNVKFLSDAHQACLREFVHLVYNGEPKTIIVDNTNISLIEMAPYVSVAKAYGYDVEIKLIDCDPEVAAARNVHGVPKKKIIQMNNRLKQNFNIPKIWKKQ